MKKLTIALVAHDNRKAEMVEWAVHNAEFLSHTILFVRVRPEIWFVKLSRKKG